MFMKEYLERSTYNKSNTSMARSANAMRKGKKWGSSKIGKYCVPLNIG